MKLILKTHNTKTGEPSETAVDAVPFTFNVGKKRYNLALHDSLKYVSQAAITEVNSTFVVSHFVCADPLDKENVRTARIVLEEMVKKYGKERFCEVIDNAIMKAGGTLSPT